MIVVNQREKIMLIMIVAYFCPSYAYFDQFDILTTCTYFDYFSCAYLGHCAFHLYTDNLE